VQCKAQLVKISLEVSVAKVSWHGPHLTTSETIN